MGRKAQRTGGRKLPSTKPADQAPHLSGTKGKVGRPTSGASAANEPLTFKVSADFKRRFRRYAVDHDLRLNQVLVLAFEALEAREPR